jgi:hypothetical protein
VFDWIVCGIIRKTASVLYSEEIFLQFSRLQEKHPILKGLVNENAERKGSED